jgi:hypothetical protein
MAQLGICVKRIIATMADIYTYCMMGSEVSS